jgi:hypothetical protein
MGKTVELERLLSKQEAAELCGVAVCPLIRARHAGELRVIKRGRLIRYRASGTGAGWAQGPKRCSSGLSAPLVVRDMPRSVQDSVSCSASPFSPHAPSASPSLEP